jgi:hypothetical protein
VWQAERDAAAALMFLDAHEDKFVPEPNTGCLIWTGSCRGEARYLQPQVRVGKTTKGVARLVCEEVNGPPPTLEHHAAHNTPNGCIGNLCVNGGHLRWATPSENTLDIPKEVLVGRAARMNANFSSEQRSESQRGERYEASVLGLRFYFTGQPCRRGHIDKRYVSSGVCLSCSDEDYSKRRSG